MKISASWLREWVSHDLDAAALADTLTMLGVEVDAISPVAPGISGVVVGQVTDVRRHPNADKLTLCRVNAGDSETLEIVCGAANVRIGGCYPVARVGATLAGGLSIRRSKIRGEPSEGMLCSATELGLEAESEGLLELAADAIPGTDVVALLDLDDQILDLNITPNRADCFSIRGVSREVAAARSLAFQGKHIPAVPARHQQGFPVRVEDPADCPRFVGRVIRNLNVATTRTPAWMRERLRRSGVRAIHPVVDVTNYVMLELGQPMHAYDLARLRDEIVVRRGRKGETLTLLDGRSLDLDEALLIIADGRGPVGVAGIMGGSASGVAADTTNIFLESAFFSPAAIAGRARRLGFQTDASTRFERGVDPALQDIAVERATALICEIAGGEPGPLVDRISRKHLPVPQPVTLRRQRVAAVLGLDIPDAEITGILSRLGMAVRPDAGGWQVAAPSWRFDIEREEDLIEEIARLHGYQRIPETVGAWSPHLQPDTESRIGLDRARILLVDRGFQEVVTYSFVDPQSDKDFSAGDPPLALANPISADLAVMRRSLWPGLVRAAQRNLDRQQSRVTLFEIGTCFRVPGGVLNEQVSIAGLHSGSRWPEHWDGSGPDGDLFDVKGDVEALLALTGEASQFEFRAAEHPALHPARSAAIFRQDRELGWIGELNPRLAQRLELRNAMVLFEILAEPALAARVPVYQGISKFPAVRRDLALLVDEGVPAVDLVETARAAAPELLKDVIVFDIYTGKQIGRGQKSVAMGLILQDTSRTLTESDVDRHTTAVTTALKQRFNASIRE